MAKGFPVVISEFGTPVIPVDEGAPVASVAENGMGTPITIVDSGAPQATPMVVEGLPDFTPEALALFARFSTPPTYLRRVIINQLIESLIDSGVWAKLDALYLLAANDSQAACLNWVSNQYNCTPVASPVFTANRGYQGNGTSSYLDTGFNPTTAISPKFAQNDSHAGIWSRTDIAMGVNDSFDAFSTTTRIVRSIATPGQANCRPSNMTTSTLGANAYPGHAMWARSASNLWEGYAQGVDSGGGTEASTAITNANFRLLSASAAEFGLNQLAAAHFGSNLTAGEAAIMYGALRTYLIRVGAA